ncbi:MAG: ABC transporter substrate-binding protein [Alphaproteobacteria bacterium]|nr:MAG: ABC transporter substrate-binding protein [Alphaproteobacteria bacterium]TMJ49592.1 MAG: ABC transporter substrate-binding protein [Alphaproteobacteria bacterium]
MNLKGLVLGTTVAVTLGVPAAIATAYAADGIYVPLLSYRTGPYAGSGTPIANGMSDYLNMLNERDGGIGGVKIIVEECETGYDTKKGIECYESIKGKGPVVVNPYSTGITLQLIPKAAVDKIPILSMGYGLSPSADGNQFPWIFNPPATYWDGASVFVKHAAEVEGGFDKLKGKKLGLVYLDAPYGKEPIPLLEQLAKDYGFELKLYPVPGSEMQNQSSLWLNIRRDRPNWIYLQGWGAMNPTAVKEAAKAGFPMDRLVGVWWSGGDDDARAAGTDAKGYSSLDINAVGTGFPAIQDILKYVVDKGKSQVGRDKVGENLYNRGVLNSVLIAEAIRTAQQLTGKKQVSGEDVRRGLETLKIAQARWKEIGLENFAAPINVSCSDHNGHHGIYLAQWDGTKWTKASEWIEPIKDKVMPLIESQAKEYVGANAGWPKRTEPCDKSS